LLLCQITSKAVRDQHAITLDAADFQAGSLKKQSNVRPNRVFTADAGIVLYLAGHLTAEKTSAVVEGLVAILRE
jgi:mRNA interferase MazF